VRRGPNREKVSFSRDRVERRVAAGGGGAPHCVSKNKLAPAGAHGEDVQLISYLPAAITTLFTLAASLLLGYLQ